MGNGEWGARFLPHCPLPTAHSPSSLLYAVAQIRILPKPDAAAHPENVGDDFDVGAEIDRDVSGVAAADVEPVEMGQRAEDLYGPGQSLVPFGLADFFERAIAKLLFVGLPFTEGNVRQLYVWREPAVFKKRRPEPRAERDHHLDPSAFDRAQALHVGVVDDDCGSAGLSGYRPLQIEAVPFFGPEVCARQRSAFANRAGKSDRHSVERRKLRRQFL